MMLIGTSLSACHRQSQSDVLEKDPFAASRARPEDRFGKGFGQAFRADPKSEPAKVKPGDVAPLSTTAEPLPVD
jgi:hypothetical protein